MLFPEGGFQLSQAGQTGVANNIAPKLRGLQNAKVVVYGYTDNAPVGPVLQRQGVPDNFVLSTRRAATVVSFLVSQGVNSNVISAKGFDNTGRGLPQPIDGYHGTGRLTPCRGGAVDLWTVGCADPRLTASAVPYGQAGENALRFPTLPTGRRLPTSFTAPHNNTGWI